MRLAERTWAGACTRGRPRPSRRATPSGASSRCSVQQLSAKRITNASRRARSACSSDCIGAVSCSANSAASSASSRATSATVHCRRSRSSQHGANQARHRADGLSAISLRPRSALMKSAKLASKGFLRGRWQTRWLLSLHRLAKAGTKAAIRSQHGESELSNWPPLQDNGCRTACSVQRSPAVVGKLRARAWCRGSRIQRSESVLNEVCRRCM